MTIAPIPNQLRALAERPDDAPVTMLNLLKFKADGGRAAYAKYGEGVAPLLADVGARVLWQGSVDGVVIGDAQDLWDAVVLVWYPSARAFLEMVSSERYAAVGAHRTTALEDSRLIALSEVSRAV